MTTAPIRIASAEDFHPVLQRLCEHCASSQFTPNIRLAAPLGIGKPHRLLNAIYDHVAAHKTQEMIIYTALSLNPPRGKSELEKRFLTPFVERIYGADFPRLKYADDQQKGALPSNISVQEFYLQSGAYLNNALAQASYNSLNYTHVAGALADSEVNVLVQKVASDGQGNYSLSSNTDLTVDVLRALEHAGKPRPLCIAEIDPELPWVGGSAVVDDEFFDIVIEHTQPAGHLFALPRQPVGDVEYAIGFYASTLIKDGGTLQIGIGALSDALCYALILRHTQNQTYRNILNALNPTLIDSDLITQHGGVESFEIGLYGCSEMVNEGFRALVQQGVVRRRVSEDSAMMERINANKATPDDNERLAKNGKYLHGAFYLGSPEFYQWVREQGQQHNTLGMQRVSQVNSVTGEHYHLEKEQRLYPRFINTCMMATPFGGAVSDTLPDGRVVSGVGGQYNFVSMGFNLPNARSMLLLRAVRQQGQQQISNIRWTLGNVTVPRHLRDLLITEYGIADLRYATDAECVKRVLAITDESAVDELIAEAVSSLKLSPNNTSEKSELSGQLAADNNADQIVNALAPFRQSGDLLDYPLGSDFTDTEQRLVRALSLLKTAMSSKKDMLSMLTKAVFAKKVDSEAIARMGLANPKSVKEHLYQRLLNVALAQTSD